jgi:hypothetical protein
LGVFWCGLEAVYDPANPAWGNCDIDGMFNVEANGVTKEPSTTAMATYTISENEVYSFHFGADVAPEIEAGSLQAQAMILQRIVPSEEDPAVYFIHVNGDVSDFSLVNNNANNAVLASFEVAVAASPSSTAAPSTVLTVAGTGTSRNGEACVFPFMYNGITYDSCTCVDLGTYWCGLSAMPAVDGKYGLCDTNTFNTTTVPCEANAGNPASGGETIFNNDFVPEDNTNESTSSAAGGGLSSSAVIAIVAGVLATVLVAVGIAMHRQQTSSSHVLPFDKEINKEVDIFGGFGSRDEDAIPGDISNGTRLFHIRDTEV